MAEAEMEKKKTSPSMMLDSSLHSDSVSELQLTPSSSETKELNPDWSLLPEELLQLIPKHVGKSLVGAIRARSVCHSWRSTPIPSPQSYSLPSVLNLHLSCTLKKIPLFLFRVKTPPTSPSEYYLGGISHKDHQTELLQSPSQCSVNMLDCQILSLGHRYRIIGLDPKDTKRPMALLPLNEEGGYIVLLYYSKVLWALRSSNKKWTRFGKHSTATCQDLFTFRGKFYVSFLNGSIFVINPYNLKDVKPLKPPQDLNSSKYLVPSSDDEVLFLVEKINPTPGVLDLGRLACRVSKLDEEAGEWVVVSDLGDRILFIGRFGNVSCSGKELPDGCGLTKNSILFTDESCHVNYVYKYGGETGNVEDGGFLRLSRENRVLILKRSKSVVALRVESPKPNWSLLPENLLQLISTHLEKKRSSCFFIDAIHARSVCRLWRSTFPLPDVNQSHTLPFFTDFTRGMVPKGNSCTVKKFPLFLFRVKTQTTPKSPPPSEFFLGGICREDNMEILSPSGSPQRRSSEYFHEDFGSDDDESQDDYYPESPPSRFIEEIGQEDHHHTELPSAFQCSVKAVFPEYHPILTNIRDCQIVPLGHYYKLMGSYPDNMKRAVAFLQLNKKEDEYVVLLNSFGSLLVYRSSEKRWIKIERISNGLCIGLYTFRGKFYVIFHNGEIIVIDPYNPMEATLLTTQDLDSNRYLVPSNDDEELFLVEKTISTCRLSKLDEETGEWIVVNGLGDRVLITGQLGNFVFPVKEFPQGCGLSGNSILIADDYRYLSRGKSFQITQVNVSNVTFAYKYDDLGFWRLSREDRVLIRNHSPPVLALQIDRIRNKCFL